MPTPWADDLKQALAIVASASDLVLSHYRSRVALETASANISTETDHASQELILRFLATRYPEDGLIAEEDTPARSDYRARAALCETPPRRWWIVDPIDGTRGFALKNDEFAIMVGLVEQGQVVVGVVGEPALGRVTWATLGGGCWTQGPWDADPVRCQVGDSRSLATSVFAVSRSRQTDDEDSFRSAFGLSDVVRMYSAGLKLARVAMGEADGYRGDYVTLKDWDIAAGHILVTEAGGRVTTFDGHEIVYGLDGASLRARGILATNGWVHDEALAVLARQGEAHW